MDTQSLQLEDFSVFEKDLHDVLCSKSEIKLSRVVSSECSQIQHDEFVALKAIFEDDLALVDDDARCFKITLMDKSKQYMEDEVLDIWFSIPADYPNIPPLFELEGHGAISCQKADELYDYLLQEAIAKVPETMLYDLIMTAKEFLNTHINERRELQKDQFADDTKENSEESFGDITEDDRFYYSKNWHLKPNRYTGPVHKVLEKVPRNLQVASVESILREDLAHRFESKKSHFETKYFKNARANPHAYNLELTLGFHGTPQGNIPNIVRTGLQIPGQNNSIPVAHGSALGLGIYLSTDPSYSFGYCDAGGTVLVCCVLLGHVKKGSAAGSFDSLVTSDDKVMVIFHPSQVLPCYVIRLVSRSDERKYTGLPLPSNIVKGSSSESREEEDEKSRRERLLVRAKKFLPFGFGPTSERGPKMVVEDVADSDDDEEQYGQYQEYRYLQD